MNRFVNALSKLKWGKASAVFVLCATMPIALTAQTLTTLHSFNGTDGAGPQTVLVQTTNGELYGTTLQGGANGYGTVFKITPSGTLTTLYSFCSQNGCADGQNPWAGLVQATNGDLYGTTQGGGANGHGTVFRITPGGAVTTLYSFCAESACADGAEPEAGLIQAINGDLYGMTSSGGDPSGSFGTVFKITPGGALTTLYIFAGNFAGVEPTAELIQAANGDLYGTTYLGGVSGAGTIFRMTPGGSLTTLYSFCSQINCADGENPIAGLVQAANGDFYGTTELGGASGHGTVFKITPGGSLTTLYSLCSQTNCADGGSPIARLVQATNGDLYGTATYYGGSNGGNGGTVFRITPSGTFTTLYIFCSKSGCADGFAPDAGLIQATNGTLYGTTIAGGASGSDPGDGTIFSLSVGLGPFVEIRPAAGEAGASVEILGSDLTGASSVSFNGTAAKFTVVSRYLITTSVPPGASTGKVKVVTPSSTLSSNVSFGVVP
jgi:uncharacterized repeat protein (TIGR03803 family)